MIKVGINGFGRIGRMILRAMLEQQTKDIQVVLINGTMDSQQSAHLLKYDSTHGTLPTAVTAYDDGIDFGQGKVKVLTELKTENIPWKDYGVDIVLECTGRIKDREQALLHITKGGAKKVIISAPAEYSDAMLVYGVNHTTVKKGQVLFSNASCTTNCLAPLALLLNNAYTIKHGFMNTVHAYTSDQNLIDGTHKDLYRGRSAVMSIVPTSTGAAKSIGLVIPALNKKLDGVSLRVPTPNVSCVDLQVELEQPTTVDQLKALFTEASQGAFKGIVSVTNEPLVSIDFNHNPHSAIVALDQFKVYNQGRSVRLLAWYDNEWGFSNRMIDTTRYIAHNS